MGDDITIGVTEIVNNIEVTAQPSDQVIELSVIDNADDVTLNITPTVVEININKGSSYAKWGTILGNLPDQEDLQNVLNLKADLVSGKVPASQLPSYVDDVVEVASYEYLPAIGEVDKIYITLDTNKVYRWGGSSYVEIASNSAVWGGITGTLSSQTDLQTALDTKALKTITITTNSPLTGGGDLSANRTISIPQADSVTNGYISGADWTRFDNKQPALIGVGFVKISGTTISYDNSTYVPTSRTITINGTGYDLSDNRTFNVGTVTSVAALTLGTTGTNINSTVANGTTTPVITLNIPTASATNRGALSSTDWSTFNSKEPAISSGTNLQYLRGDKTWQLLTTDAVSEGGNLYFTDSRARSAVTGFSGSINYLSKFTSNATIGSSIIYDDGTQIGIGTNVPQRKLSVRDINNTYSATFSGSAGLNMVAIGTVSGATNGVPSIAAFTNSFAATTNLAINPTGGNVGIGTTSPATLFQVKGNGNNMISLQYTSDGGAAGYGFYNSSGTELWSIGGGRFVSQDALEISRQGSLKFLINSSGNVGIGTTWPSEKLHIGGVGSKIAFDTTGLAASNWIGTTNDYWTSIVCNRGDNSRIDLTNANGIRLQVASKTIANVVSTGLELDEAELNTPKKINFQANRTTVGDLGSITWKNIQWDGFIRASIKGIADTALSNGGLVFSTGATNSDATERMRITSGGDVGIGVTSTSSYKLYVAGGQYGTLLRGGDLGTGSIALNVLKADNSEAFKVRGDGLIYMPFVYSNTSGGAANVGIASSGELYRSTSSLKYKKNVENYTKGLNEIMQMRPVTYNSINENEDGVQYAGLIAEEIHDLGLTEFVQYANDGTPDALAYSNMVALLIKGIQELKAEIEILKTK